ncbi:hypothetical protein PRIPAC_77143 [Pristionchus pacificus]|uniref:Glutathione peroxidase n=1 Tax=Pristionchus pacificus TaxID=54126 RepID=A0A454XYQ2_PRIPA|nr:hypothetical protein PRIPAC_77143 [Pristionchus pacificus]|eukprot:PDM72875.1 gpx-1 protein [Pristionchus pacificus]
MSQSFYEFKVKDANGKDVSLGEKYKGQVVIVVNVASKCGLTPVNYTQLKEILDQYKDRGLAIAAFPCNQFADQILYIKCLEQEPDCSADIEEFVKKEYSLEPDLYAKIEVNGDGADPLWKWLRKQKSKGDSVKWNFTKFLISRRGEIINRYGPTVEPKSFIADIEKALAKPSKL